MSCCCRAGAFPHLFLFLPTFFIFGAAAEVQGRGGGGDRCVLPPGGQGSGQWGERGGMSGCLLGFLREGGGREEVFPRSCRNAKAPSVGRSEEAALELMSYFYVELAATAQVLPSSSHVFAPFLGPMVGVGGGGGEFPSSLHTRRKGGCVLSWEKQETA